MQFPLIAVAYSPEEFEALVRYAETKNMGPVWLTYPKDIYKMAVDEYGPGIGIIWNDYGEVDGWCEASWYSNKPEYKDWPQVKGWDFLAFVEGETVDVDVTDFL